MERLSDRILSEVRADRQDINPDAHRENSTTKSHLPRNVRERIKKHRKRGLRLTIAFVIALVLLVAGALTGLAWPVKTPTGEATSTGKILANLVGVTRPLPHYFGGNSNVYLLVVGVDKDPPHRSDTVMVVNVDLKNYGATILSIPRDTIVLLPNGNRDKLAHSYAYGQNGKKEGVGWVKFSVENLLGISTPYYLTIDFQAFVSIVDTLGGVEINVEKPLRYTDRSQKLFINIPAGIQVLSGDEMLNYVRFRHDALGDIGRTERQHRAIMAILHRLKQERNWGKVFETLKIFYKSVQTNLTLDQLVALARRLDNFGEENIYAETMKAVPEMINGVSYMVASDVDISNAVSLLTDGPGRTLPTDDELAGSVGRREADTVSR